MAKVSNIGKVPDMGVKFWKGIAKMVGGTGGWVYKDGEKGLMQNNTQKHPLSQKYREYKNKDMRRLDGKRLRNKKYPLEGRSLHTIGKPHVTMILTGDTIGGLHGEKATKNGITMSFMPKDAPKVIGNKQRGYDIVGLNDKNIRLIKAEMIKQFNKNKVKYLKKNIVISVGK